MPPKAFVSWSSGKDSAFALWEAQRQELVEVVGILTTVNETYNRVAMHGVRDSLLDRQIAALGLPSVKVPLPIRCSNEIYESRMRQAIDQITAAGVRHMVFGDLFLESVRSYRETQLAQCGMQGLFPLWQRDTRRLPHEMIASGLVAHIVCLDPQQLDPSFAGRRFDQALLADLPAGVDPCGENGEFHTVVSAGPMLKQPIPITLGEVVHRDGFVFADAIAGPISAGD